MSALAPVPAPRDKATPGRLFSHQRLEKGWACRHCGRPLGQIRDRQAIVCTECDQPPPARRL